MRVFAPIVFAALFLGWLLYRIFIAKDVKKYKNEVFGGFFFIVVWLVIYCTCKYFLIK